MEYFTQLLPASIQDNPVFLGAFSLWGLSVISFLFWKLPSKIGSTITKYFTVRLTLYSTGISGNSDNAEVYANFIDWFHKYKGFKWSRSTMLIKTWSETFIGPGPGNHFFIMNKRLFWINIYKEESGGNNYNTPTNKFTATLVTFGRNMMSLERLITDYFLPKDDIRMIKLKHFGMNGWETTGYIPKRKLNSVFTTGAKERIVKYTDEFLASQKRYDDLGISYKIAFLLTGEPGTGKSSLIRAIASHYSRPIHILNLNSVTPSSLTDAFVNSRAAVLVIEDIDSSSVVKNRKAELSNRETNLKEALQLLTLSDLLNAMDGIAGMDDVIVFVTTNHPENLDPALIRKGRIDHQFELGKLTDKEIREFAKYAFPGIQLQQEFKYESMTGANLQSILLENMDIEGFHKELDKHIVAENKS